jgi:5'-3' exonuclease
MARFAVIDINNLFYRAAKGVQGDAFTRSGMSLHIAFQSFRKLVMDMGCEHLVICAEGRSWRYKAYPEYKAKRRLEKAARTAAEREDDAVLQAALDDLLLFLSEQTRVTVLRSDNVEGDDFIARFIRLHPNDEHILLSSDSDFIQLIADNVTIYDAMLDRIITKDGVKDGKGRPLVFSINSSTGKIKIAGTVDDETERHRREQKLKKKTDPTHEITEFEWSIDDKWWERALFLKMVRGDSGDGIFSAFPGVRYAGTKKKVGIIDAWNDRHEKGFEWNNFMQQTWEKLIGSNADGEPLTETVKVEDEIARNRSLIDLTQQPKEVVAEMDAVIVNQIQKKPVTNVGMSFLKFCGKHQLARAGQDAAYHGMYLNSGYPMGG